MTIVISSFQSKGSLNGLRLYHTSTNAMCLLVVGSRSGVKQRHHCKVRSEEMREAEGNIREGLPGARITAGCAHCALRTEWGGKALVTHHCAQTCTECVPLACALKRREVERRASPHEGSRLPWYSARSRHFASHTHAFNRRMHPSHTCRLSPDGSDSRLSPL